MKLVPLTLTLSPALEFCSRMESTAGAREQTERAEFLRILRHHYSGSGLPLVSGMNGIVSRPIAKIEHIVTPAYRNGVAPSYPE